MTRQVHLNFEHKEKLAKLKFAILLKLILLTYDIGIFEEIPNDMEYGMIYNQIENSTNIEEVQKKYKDLLGEII